jgi:hypothetical protein
MELPDPIEIAVEGRMTQLTINNENEKVDGTQWADSGGVVEGRSNSQSQTAALACAFELGGSGSPSET